MLIRDRRRFIASARALLQSHRPSADSTIPSEGEKVNGSARPDSVNMHALRVNAWVWAFDPPGRDGSAFRRNHALDVRGDNDPALTLGFLHVQSTDEQLRTSWKSWLVCRRKRQTGDECLDSFSDAKDESILSFFILLTRNGRVGPFLRNVYCDLSAVINSSLS